MFLLLKRLFVIVFVLMSSSFTVSANVSMDPATWNICAFNPKIIEIKDVNNNLIAVQPDRARSESWNIHPLGEEIIQIKDAAGKEIAVQILIPGKNHKLIKHNDAFYVLPEQPNTQQPSSNREDSVRSDTPSCMIPPVATAYFPSAAAPQSEPSVLTSPTAGSKRPASTVIDLTVGDDPAQKQRRLQNRFKVDLRPILPHPQGMQVEQSPVYNLSANVIQCAPGAPTARSPSGMNEDLGKRAFWQVASNQAGYLELCNAHGDIINTIKARTAKAPKALRKFNRGYLNIRHGGVHYYLPRGPKDFSDLEVNGFAPGSNATFKVYNPGYVVSSDKSECRGINFKDIRCWRIHPENDRLFQLLGMNRKVLLNHEIYLRSGEISHTKRSLRLGFLVIKTDDGQELLFARDPEDVALLSYKYFSGSDASPVYFHTYNGILTVENSMPPEQSQESADIIMQESDSEDHSFEEEFVQVMGDDSDSETDVDDEPVIDEANGLAPDSSESVQIKGENGFAESLSLLAMEVAKQVVCWRIHPARKGFVQLINTDGHIVHVAEVLIRSRRKRKLPRGFLLLKTAAGKGCWFKRHPDDNIDLEKNGFLPGQKPKFLDLLKAPIIVEESAMESRDMDAVVIEISDEPEVEMSGNISVPEYSSDSESSDDELMIVEE